MEPFSAPAELGGIAAFAVLVLILLPICAAAERRLARRRANVTAAAIKAGRARYVRTPEGSLRVRVTR